MSPSQLPNLHDAIFVRVEITWATGEAMVELSRFPDTRVVLLARGLRGFKMTRRHDWGPSISVNAASLRTNDAGEAVLEIELQSGDLVEAVAAKIDVV